MRASPAWQVLLRDISAGQGPPGVHSLVTPQRLAPAMVTEATVATHTQTRPHSALTPGLVLPTSHGTVLWKEETEGDLLAPGPWGSEQSWAWARGADRTVGLRGSGQSWPWAQVGLGAELGMGLGQSWAWAQVGLEAELGVGPGGQQDCGAWGRAGRGPGGPTGP